MTVYSKLISNSRVDGETGIFRYTESVPNLKDLPQGFPSTITELFEKSKLKTIILRYKS
jgi:hypothetical protein